MLSTINRVYNDNSENKTKYIYITERKKTMIQAKFIEDKWIIIKILNTEAFTQRCCENEVFLQISQNSKENACARVSFLIKLQLY